MWISNLLVYGKFMYCKKIMGTDKHSEASKKRWKKVPKAKRKEMMGSLRKEAWAKLDPKARRKQALRAAKTRKAKKEALLKQQ